MIDKLIILACVSLFAFIGGYKVSDWKHNSDARYLEQLQRTADDKDRERVEAISTTYQQLTAELQRIRSNVKTEVFHETHKIEYRCIIPDSGQLLINSAIDSANQAIAGSIATLSNDKQTPN